MAKIDEEIACEVREEERKKRHFQKVVGISALILLFMGLTVFLVPSLRKLANIMPVAQAFLPPPEEGTPVISLEKLVPLGKGRIRCVLRYRNSAPGKPITIRTVEIFDKTDEIDYVFPVEVREGSHELTIEFTLDKEALPAVASLTLQVTDAHGYPSNLVVAKDVSVF